MANVLRMPDSTGRAVGSARWGIYAFYDYDEEPIYVGQSYEKLSGRIGRHLTNQRTDAVAMRVLDPFEVFRVQMWPLWQYDEIGSKHPDFALAKAHLDQLEYSAYVYALNGSRFGAILNEKIPRPCEVTDLPESVSGVIIPDELIEQRKHSDVRIERRTENLSRLTKTIRERGEVTAGLRRVAVVQAVRLAWLSALRHAETEGLEPPTPDTIDLRSLLGASVFEPEPGEEENGDEEDMGDADTDDGGGG